MLTFALDDYPRCGQYPCPNVNLRIMSLDLCPITLDLVVSPTVGLWPITLDFVVTPTAGIWPMASVVTPVARAVIIWPVTREARAAGLWPVILIVAPATLEAGLSTIT